LAFGAFGSILPGGDPGDVNGLLFMRQSGKSQSRAGIFQKSLAKARKSIACIREKFFFEWKDEPDTASTCPAGFLASSLSTPALMVAVAAGYPGIR
jgi:hypothetical protein